MLILKRSMKTTKNPPNNQGGLGAPFFLRPLTHLSRFLRQMSPQSLLGRSFLIMALPIILAQGATSYIFFNHHWDTLERRLAVTLANEMVMLVQAEAKGYPHVPDMADALDIQFIRSTSSSGVDGRQSILSWIASLFDQEGMLRRELENRLPYPLTVETSKNWVTVTVVLPHHHITLSTTPKKIFSSTVFVYVLWSVGLCILLVLVAWGFMRNQMHPIRDLATAAEIFGQEGKPKRLKPRGALEVRKATRAFNIMQDNILKHVAERTEMLAGISHDLRTPLTRLRLALEMTPEDIKHDMLPDVLEMQAMIDSYLAFARDDQGEDWQCVEISSFLASLAVSFHPEHIKILPSHPIHVRAKPLLLRRCLVNLMNNALTYGTLCTVSVQDHKRFVDITVGDNGPGLTPEAFERAKTPFVRLGDERTIGEGHVGLGLSIAEDIAKRHGHPLRLATDTPKGANIIIRLSPC
jgi:two-component system osmolarity sensor histidine kinase EnvZ